MKRVAYRVLHISVVFIVALSSCAKRPESSREDSKRNVILMIGDGMGFPQIELAQNFNPQDPLNIWALPHTAIVRTRSADNFITDSAAAATALASGHLTKNKAIGVLPDGTNVESIAVELKKKGYRVGIVVKNTITDATPAAFYAHVRQRSENELIAKQLLEAGFDVLLGGGAEDFDAKMRKDGKDLILEFQKAGYSVIRTRDELSRSKSGKLLGLFHSSHMSYVIDRVHEKKVQEPTLAQMTDAALQILDSKDEAFFLLVEGSRIDHAAHAVDPRALVDEMRDFDEAIDVAAKFAKKDSKTLVLVTADHETMDIQASEAVKWEGLKRIKASAEAVAMKIQRDSAGKFLATSIRETIQDVYGLKLSDDEVRLIQSRSAEPTYKIGWIIGSVVTPYFGVGSFTDSMRSAGNTNGHSADPVGLFCVGRGAEACRGTLDHPGTNRLMRAYLSLPGH